MIGWPLSRPCAVACLFGDESQQPIFPHVMHMRRWTQPLPVFKHSSQPATGSGNAVTSISSRCVQLTRADMASPLVEHAAEQRDGEVAGVVGPPELGLQSGRGG